MKKLLFLFFLLIGSIQAKAQLGSDTVCVGKLYTYSVTINSGDSVSWTIPSGWIVVDQPATDIIVVYCNMNVGDVCAQIFDSTGVAVNIICQTTFWGGEGITAQVSSNPENNCQCSGYYLTATFDTISCGGSCGNGVPSSNVFLGIFDQPVVDSSTIYFGPADGSVLLPRPTSPFTYYIVPVDTTFGWSNVITLSGGACGSFIPPTFTLFDCTVIGQEIISTPSTYCAGDTVLFSYTGNLGAMDSINWIALNEKVRFIGSLNNDSVYAIVRDSDIVSIEGFQGVCANTGMLEVGPVNCGVFANFSTTETHICQNTCLTFTNLSLHADSVQWIFAGGDPQYSFEFNPPPICFYDTGRYDVVLTSFNAYGFDTRYDTAMIVVSAVNSMTVSLNGDTLIATPGFTSYVWSYGGNVIPGQNSDTLIATSTGFYSVYGEIAANCNSNTDSVYYLNTDLIQTLSYQTGIYPNPAHSFLNISNLNRNEKAEIRIIDQFGKILSATFISNEQLDISSLLPGVYVVEIIQANSRIQKLFVKS